MTIRVWISVAWFVLAVLLYLAACDYIDQQRYVSLGFCPPGVNSPGPGVLLYDTRDPGLLCLPVPLPPPSRDTIMPSPGALDRRPKIGV